MYAVVSLRHPIAPNPAEAGNRAPDTGADAEAEAAAVALEARRWAALRARDRAADGSFVYSVRTTGVYCRPSCGSRRARPENVAFHDSSAAAERAGFRACKRCRPDAAGAAGGHAERIAAACRRIEAATDGPPRLEELAREAGLSPHHFHRLFRAATGLTPRGFAQARRQQRLREGLRDAASVTEAMYAAGYNSSARFYDESAAVLGMTASRYRAGGAGSTIRFAVGQCSLGAILVAEGERGVCAILLGDDPQALVADLQERFPKARLLGGDAAFEQRVAIVVGFVEAPRIGLELPLDLRGTAFQQRVWQALRAVPAGQTASYAEIARRIGAPGSARAVAAACAANPLAVAIPCHRVVRADGGLSGYRWGIARKRALLDREAAASD